MPRKTPWARPGERFDRGFNEAAARCRGKLSDGSVLTFTRPGLQ